MVYTIEHLENLEKSKLIEIIIKLQQKTNKSDVRDFENRNLEKTKKPWSIPEADWSSVKFRRIALKFAYLGKNYDGLQIQKEIDNTIESHLWNAIVGAKLRPKSDMPGLVYTRCARTDKGVSAFQQVVTIDLKSNLKNFEGKEFDFVSIINSRLPPDIRVLSWATCPENFDSRFSCIHRTYQYIFPVTDNMDLSKMQTACNYFTGAHDFRNFCKISMSTAKHHLRRILNATVTRSKITKKIAVLEITSTGFLYHQIRITMTILLHIGIGNEKPEIVKDLLEIDDWPKRMQLCMASDLPLMLTNCYFDENEPKWQDSFSTGKLLDHFSRLWFEKMVEAQQVEVLIEKCGFGEAFNSQRLLKLLSNDFKSKKHISFKNRPKCPSLEEEVEKESLKQQRRSNRYRENKDEYVGSNNVLKNFDKPLIY